jgi:hypothetical protein
MHTTKICSAMRGLLVPTLLLGLSACALPENDNSATRDMMIRFSELGLPKDGPRAAAPQCADAAQMAKTFDGVARPSFSRCPPGKVAAAHSSGGG